jgi:ATP-dependent Clp protease adaptor protein ClpS
MTIQTDVIEKKKTTNSIPKEPSKYKVIVFNDDHTSVEFVIAMLITVFNYSQDNALKLTLEIHNAGSAVVGVYSHEIAEQKVIEASDMARSHGYPLILKAEAE